MPESRSCTLSAIGSSYHSDPNRPISTGPVFLALHATFLVNLVDVYYASTRISRIGLVGSRGTGIAPHAVRARVMSLRVARSFVRADGLLLRRPLAWQVQAIHQPRIGVGGPTGI